MSRFSSLSALAAIAAGLFLWNRSANAAEVQNTQETGFSPPLDSFSPDYASYSLIPLDYPIPDLEFLPIPEISFYGDEMNSRTKAFLYAIRRSEHTAPDVASGVDYQTFYGGSRFYDMTDHPVITGEQRGVPLSAAMCRAVGLNPGCVSTAAGAYQMIRPTWQRVRAAGLWGPRLADFMPESQDEAARRLLIECGALSSLEAGNVREAITKASKLWASLPGSTAGQGGRNLDFVVAAYNDALSNFG